jgi:hypothetical protein
VAAFEELVGSRGVMGDTQSLPFLPYSRDLETLEAECVGGKAVLRLLRSWLVRLGHDELSEVV